MADAAKRYQVPLRGVFYMLVTAVVIFPLLNASVKYLAVDYSLVQIIWIRSVVHLVWMMVLFMPYLGLRIFATRRLKLQLVRSLLQLAALTSFIVGLLYIPMTSATAIFFTGPLIVVALAGPVLGERVGFRRRLAVLVGFAGALVIIHPDTLRCHCPRIFRSACVARSITDIDCDGYRAVADSAPAVGGSKHGTREGAGVRVAGCCARGTGPSVVRCHRLAVGAHDNTCDTEAVARVLILGDVAVACY